MSINQLDVNTNTISKDQIVETLNTAPKFPSSMPALPPGMPKLPVSKILLPMTR